MFAYARYNNRLLNQMEGDSKDKVKICDKYKVDFTYLKDRFTNILEEESNSFDLGTTSFIIKI